MGNNTAFAGNYRINSSMTEMIQNAAVEVEANNMFMNGHSYTLVKYST